MKKIIAVAVAILIVALGLSFDGGAIFAGVLTGNLLFGRPVASASNYLAGTAGHNASAVPPDGTWPTNWPAPPKGVPVLSNSCSAGHVTVTLDDGPDQYTLALASELKAEHIPAIFFEIGDKVNANPGITRELVRQGFVIENHTYNHEDLTGIINKTAPLTDSQLRVELKRTNAAIVAAGAPRPTLWRPPYGDTNAHDTAIAAGQDLRLVMSWSNNDTITDSADTTGIPAAQITENVTSDIHAGSIVAFHDGSSDTPNTIAAIPAIVRYMNAHHLCAGTSIPKNATGGVIGSAGGE